MSLLAAQTRTLPALALALETGTVANETPSPLSAQWAALRQSPNNSASRNPWLFPGIPPEKLPFGPVVRPRQIPASFANPQPLPAREHPGRPLPSRWQADPRVVPVHQAFAARPPPNANGDLALENNVISLPNMTVQAALHYGPTAGRPAFIEWLHELPGVDVLSKAIVALFDPRRAGAGPVSRPSMPVLSLYSGAPNKSTRTQMASLPLLFEAFCTTGRRAGRNLVLYMIPCGGNPTGATTTVERRREVLALAREHNSTILEDDRTTICNPIPPSYLDPERSAAAAAAAGHHVGGASAWTRSPMSSPPGAGLRIGFASGPTPLRDLAVYPSPLVGLALNAALYSPKDDRAPLYRNMDFPTGSWMPVDVIHAARMPPASERLTSASYHAVPLLQSPNAVGVR
ncbi:Aminotran-1-2 domain-containing protein [Mycena chlorophos]|uniref:Aminotran-1-2 domain-containing protein n=1 Tax=Mycena chlorophos TaxID=658473 RepID=A0A8H6W4D5_MYCCL|nr:Aminotran-1-2 domain-containing protein [Mycena chlorophos]